MGQWEKQTKKWISSDTDMLDLIKQAMGSCEYVPIFSVTAELEISENKHIDPQDNISARSYCPNQHNRNQVMGVSVLCGFYKTSKR